MSAGDFVPATASGLLIVAALAGARLMPFGEANLLVRVGEGGPQAALTAAARSDSVMVGVPAAGFAVLHGDAARIRAVLGLAVAWQGRAPCAVP